MTEQHREASPELQKPQTKLEAAFAEKGGEEFVAALPPRQKLIVQLRLGLEGEKKSQTDTARILGITPSAVAGSEFQIRKKLENPEQGKRKPKQDPIDAYFDQRDAIAGLSPEEIETMTQEDLERQQTVDGFGAYMKRLGKFPLLTAEQEVLIMQAYAKESAAEETAQKDLLKKLGNNTQREVAKAILSRDTNGNKEHKTPEDLVREVAKNGFSLDPKQLPEIEEEIVATLSEFCTPQQLAEQKDLHRHISPVDAIFNAKRKEAREKAAVLKELQEGSEFQATISSGQKDKFDFALTESDSALDLMMNCNLRWVITLAKKTKTNGLTLEDRIQAGWFGLKRAVEMFDITKGNKFSTYSSWWIKQAIHRTVDDTDKAIRIPVHMSENLSQARRMMTELTDEFSRKPTAEELTDRLHERYNLGETRAKNIVDIYLSNTFNLASLNTPIGDGDGELGDLLRDTYNLEEDVVSQMHSEDTTAALREAMDSLTDRERTVLEKRHEEGATLDKIGEELGYSRERIRQIEALAREKLQEHTLLSSIREEYTPEEGAPQKPKTFGEEFADLFADPEQLEAQLAKLNPQQKIVAIGSLGLYGSDIQTQKAIAEELDIHQSRISSIKRRIFTILTQPDASEKKQRKQPEKGTSHSGQQRHEPTVTVYSFGNNTETSEKKSEDFKQIEELIAKTQEAAGKKGVMALLNRLPQRERKAIILRLGLNGEQKTQEQTARELKLYFPYERSVLNILTAKEEPESIRVPTTVVSKTTQEKPKPKRTERKVTKRSKSQEKNPQQKELPLDSLFEGKSEAEIMNALQGRSDRQKEIVRLRLGLDREEKHRTRTEVAQLLGLRPDNVAGQENHLLKMLEKSKDAPKPWIETFFGGKSEEEIRTAMEGQSDLKKQIVESRLGLDRGGVHRTVTEAAQQLGKSPQIIHAAEGYLRRTFTNPEKQKPKQTEAPTAIGMDRQAEPHTEKTKGKRQPSQFDTYFAGRSPEEIEADLARLNPRRREITELMLKLTGETRTKKIVIARELDMTINTINFQLWAIARQLEKPAKEIHKQPRKAKVAPVVAASETAQEQPKIEKRSKKEQEEKRFAEVTQMIRLGNIHELSNLLNPLQQEVLTLRYGLEGQGRSLQEVAKLVNRSVHTVELADKSIAAKLRNYLGELPAAATTSEQQKTPGVTEKQKGGTTVDQIRELIAEDTDRQLLSVLSKKQRTVLDAILEHSIKEAAALLHTKPGNITAISKNILLRLKYPSSYSPKKDYTRSPKTGHSHALPNNGEQTGQKHQPEEQQDDPSSRLEKLFANTSTEEHGKLLSKLTKRQKRIATLLYGLDGKEAKTIEEVANIVGVSPENIKTTTENFIYKKLSGEIALSSDNSPASDKKESKQVAQTEKTKGKRQPSQFDTYFAGRSPEEIEADLARLNPRRRKITELALGITGEAKNKFQIAQELDTSENSIHFALWDIARRLKKPATENRTNEQQKTRPEQAADKPKKKQKGGRVSKLRDIFTGMSPAERETILARLPNRTRMIIDLRINEHGEIERSQKEVAQLLDISKGTVSATEFYLIRELTQQETRNNSKTPLTTEKRTVTKPKETTYFSQIQDLFTEADEERRETFWNVMTEKQRAAISARLNLEEGKVKSQKEAAGLTGISVRNFTQYEKDVLKKLETYIEQSETQREPTETKAAHGETVVFDPVIHMESQAGEQTRRTIEEKLRSLSGKELTVVSNFIDTIVSHRNGSV